MTRIADELILRDVPFVRGYKVLDRIVLYGLLGRGGMGAVLLGRRVRLETDVAVKCLVPSAAGLTVEQVERFWREARLAAGIQSPHLIAVSDTDERYGLHYMVMEYVDGESAQEWVGRRGALSPREALTIVQGATLGLAAAHRFGETGVIHRDVKPPNILISRRGEVKLTDLGLASMDSDTLVTSPGSVFGTPQYMPPEQFDGATRTTPASDVYSMGATLYFLLSDKLPYAGMSLPEIVRNVVSGFPLDPEVMNALPSGVQEILRCSTANRPADRYPDAIALSEALTTELSSLGGALDLSDLATRSRYLELQEDAPTREVLAAIATEAARPVADVPVTEPDLGATGPGPGHLVAEPRHIELAGEQFPAPRSRLVPIVLILVTLVLGGGLFAAFELGLLPTHAGETAPPGDWAAFCESLEAPTDAGARARLESFFELHGVLLQGLSEPERDMVRKAMIPWVEAGDATGIAVLASLGAEPEGSWVEFASRVLQRGRDDIDAFESEIEALISDDLEALFALPEVDQSQVRRAVASLPLAWSSVDLVLGVLAALHDDWIGCVTRAGEVADIYPHGVDSALERLTVRGLEGLADEQIESLRVLLERLSASSDAALACLTLLPDPESSDDAGWIDGWLQLCQALGGEGGLAPAEADAVINRLLATRSEELVSFESSDLDTVENALRPLASSGSVPAARALALLNPPLEAAVPTLEEFIQFVRTNDYEAVESAIASGFVVPGAATTDDMLLAHYASSRDYGRVLGALLRQVDVDVADAEKGKTALHHAATSGSLDSLRVLIEHGATLDARSSFDRTALHDATIKGQDDFVRAYLEALDARGVDSARVLRIADRSGYTALHLVKDEATCSVLIGAHAESRVPINLERNHPSFRDTPLSIASMDEAARGAALELASAYGKQGVRLSEYELEVLEELDARTFVAELHARIGDGDD